MFSVAMIVGFIPSFREIYASIARLKCECIALMYYSLWDDVSRKLVQSLVNLVVAILLLGLFLAFGWVTGLVSLANQLGQIISSQMHPEPFLLSRYVREFDSEAAIDLTLLTCAGALMFFVCGKSLKPLALLIVLALAIVCAGWVARIFV